MIGKLFQRKKGFMPWAEYAAMIRMIDSYLWTNRVREISVKNIKGVGCQ